MWQTGSILSQYITLLWGLCNSHNNLISCCYLHIWNKWCGFMQCKFWSHCLPQITNLCLSTALKYICLAIYQTTEAPTKTPVVCAGVTFFSLLRAAILKRFLLCFHRPITQFIVSKMSVSNQSERWYTDIDIKYCIHNENWEYSNDQWCSFYSSLCLIEGLKFKCSS